MTKSKIEIIEETVQYYSEDPSRRASRTNETGSRVCEYLSPNGNMCAAGRCIVDPQESWEGQIDQITNRGASSVDSAVEWKFKEEYKGHEIEFWLEIQNLHDSEDCWTETGISDRGLSYVEKLKQLYK